MSLYLSRIREDFPHLNITPISRDHGATAYRIKLPVFPAGREFAWAELLLPRGFPEHATARIVLSPDAVLCIPHVDEDGGLCIDGDPGPGQSYALHDADGSRQSYTAEERIRLLLLAYQEKFLEPWLNSELDGDFSKEPLNYWLIKVGRASSRRDPVLEVWTVDESPARATIREGLLLLPARIVIAAEDDAPITSRIIDSIGLNASQRIKVLIADIPIAHTLTPITWPRSTSDLNRILAGRLRPPQHKQFRLPLRKRGGNVHRIVLLRNPTCGFAYLLPGGPATVVGDKAGRRAYQSMTAPLPLKVSRIDPSWTVGRDQHPEVADRQGLHVLIIGAGALGSQVVDHLAKAGIGFITLVDADILVSANLARHLLGAESIGQPKAKAVSQRVNLGHPATVVTPKTISAERWLQENSLSSVDLVLDLTGEPGVRWHIDRARQQYSCPLLIGWMEPYVAAAHACSLPSGTSWMQGANDLMGDLEAVSWPDEVIRQEPGCSSRFQSYTAAAAAHAVALVAENALKLIDGGSQTAKVISWVRGQRFLDEHWPNLEHREWAKPAALHDGMLLERAFP